MYIFPLSHWAIPNMNHFEPSPEARSMLKFRVHAINLTGVILGCPWIYPSQFLL